MFKKKTIYQGQLQRVLTEIQNLSVPTSLITCSSSFACFSRASILADKSSTSSANISASTFSSVALFLVASASSLNLPAS